MTKQSGSSIKEGQTAVICPECGDVLATWGKNYFTHCGKRHAVPDNLAEDGEAAENEEVTESTLEEGEKLVRCSECGTFLITKEDTKFTHCGKEQLIEDNLGDFEDLNGGEEDKDEEKAKTKSKTSSTKTRTISSDGKASRTTTKDKKDEETSKTGEEEEKSDEGTDEDADEGEVDKEVELWTCIECGCDYSDNGYSSATCPECSCEYATPYKEE